ncbi:F-box/LRR-repeat protein 3-like [Copidosoma floridanum]|uniref:F-box/LRR-repeat protein 3-like n=1 Tax=Copidosoma floridanum TaxID=29053 RepID=UPI0006C9429D|nr:F-box/LRR-repeat protein 3-like [Copidosoma floridanum]
MNKDQSKSFEVNTDHFSTALSMSTEEEEDGRGDNFMTLYSSEESFLAISSSDQLSTLQLTNTNENDPRLTTKGIITQINHCSSIRELSLSYSFLNDELLKALSGNDTLHLEILRVEAFPEAKSTAKISNETWCTFTNRFPGINLILLTYMTEEEDYEDLLSVHVPFTHLYFSECVPSSAVARVGTSCPRLVELVVSAYGPDTIDEVLIGAAHGCPKLSAVGLGDCEIT